MDDPVGTSKTTSFTLVLSGNSWLCAHEPDDGREQHEHGDDADEEDDDLASPRELGPKLLVLDIVLDIDVVSMSTTSPPRAPRSRVATCGPPAIEP